jgi:hypothetical protein
VAWARGGGTAVATVAATGQKRSLISSAGGLESTLGVTSLMGCTVLRIRLHFFFSATTLGDNTCRFGVIVEDQGSAGSVALSGPLQAPDRDWMALGTQIHTGSLAFTGVNLTTDRTKDYDFRAKRKLSEVKDDLMLFVESEANGSYSYRSDVLLALP